MPDLRLKPIGGTSVSAPILRGDGPWRIGRLEECEIRLTEDSVSRKHSRIERRGDNWTLQDLGSRHGTFLNSVRLESGMTLPLSVGDTIRIGPCSFVVALDSTSDADAPAAPVTQVLREAAVAPGTTLRRVSEQEIDNAATRRLQLLIDGAETLYRVDNEHDLAATVVSIARKASSYPRAALLRVGAGEPEVVATDPPQAFDRAGFSRSLIQEARSGSLVELTQSEAPQFGQSIGTLGITSAICAPLQVDDEVVSVLYLDAREMEEPGDRDAIGFCHALAQLGSIALGGLRRAELQERQRELVRELRAAHQAQSLLGPPESGDVGFVTYRMSWEPGQFVAGDFFDIFAIDSERVGFCLGDVSGHGVRAAILMSALAAHLNASVDRFDDLAQIVRSINKYAAEHSEPGTFASLVVGAIDRDRGTLQVMDAGHGHWFIRRADGSLTDAPLPGGLLVGVDANARYEPAELPIGPGDRIILYSDGIVEMYGEDGSLFGSDRLKEALANATSPEEDVRDGLAAMRAFAADQHPDDITVASLLVNART